MFSLQAKTQCLPDSLALTSNHGMCILEVQKIFAAPHLITHTQGRQPA